MPATMNSEASPRMIIILLLLIIAGTVAVPQELPDTSVINRHTREAYAVKGQYQ